MFQESLHAALGIKREYPTNIAAVALMAWLSNWYAKSSNLEVAGHTLPAEGAVIYIFNHLDMWDPFRLFFASQNATRDEDGKIALGRIPRGLVKSTLFGIPEPSSVRERTGKKDILNSDHPFVRALVRITIGSLLYGNGQFPVTRGTTDFKALAEADKTLKAGQPVVLSVMESRDKTGGLKGVKAGAAYIVKTNPDTYYKLVGISQDPHRVNIGDLHTFNEIKQHWGNLNLRDLTLHLADELVELLPDAIQGRWREGERQAEYQSLYPRRAQFEINS